MDIRHWLERLREELARRRLPKAYSDRLIQELADHFQDLTEKNMNTEAIASLGEPAFLAEAAARRRPGILRRHRWLRATTFVILPVPLLIMAWVLVMAILALAGQLLASAGIREAAHGLTWIQDTLVHLFLSSTVAVPATLLAGGYCLLARRTRSRQRWGVVAGVLVAVFAGLVTHQFTQSDVPGKSTVTFGVGFPPKLSVWQLLQFAVAVAVVCLCARRTRSASPAQVAP